MLKAKNYNCRCWAEPYKPEKVEKLGITAKVDLSGLPQALNERNAKLFQEKMMRNMEDRDKWTKKQFTLIPKSFWNSY